MMTTTTQRLLDLAAAAPASPDKDVVLLFLTEANALHEQGFEELRSIVAARVAGMSPEVLVAVVNGGGLPCDASQDRDELVSLLALTEWQMTPAALAYAEMAEAAARRGVCLVPEG
ncbi:hypothetical protein J8N05_18515 [Streptomyces sp. BH-SS-21]|uniref:Uncharacterized protein n=1 Tax=Streptomyces liliiviolaceus TaxID=2823109 RepID=A0A940XV50_9ACTN|nr:hypothetical protein [Streptomyces liliiviolaceus]MBQ0850193.1 hypothetical protein [Streptomyces liliiviolaceus]